MNSHWQSFLEKSGARFENNGLQNFGDPQAEMAASLQRNFVVPLTDVGVISVKGSDAQDFLQGQLSSDVQTLGIGDAALGAWCNPQGRVRVIFTLVHADEGYYLLLPMSLLDPTLKRLRMFVLRADVQMTSLENTVCIGRHAHQDDTRPAIAEPCIQTAIPTCPNRSLIFGPVEPMRSTWQQLTTESMAAGPQPWRLLSILAGIPAVMPETTEEFLPQMLNLESLGGLSFSKGCFPGQEVIARVKYRGQVKRRMYLARVATENLPAPNSRLVANEATVGQVINAEYHPQWGAALLAVIQIDAVDASPIQLATANGPALQLLELPYDL